MEYDSNAKRYFSKFSSGLNAGTIVATVLALVVTLAAVIGVFVYMKNRKKVSNGDKDETGNESAIEIIK